MATEDQQELLLSPDTGGKSNSAPRTPSQSLGHIPNSNSLEDGEIPEGCFCNSSSLPPPRQSKDQLLQPPSSSQVKCSMLVFQTLESAAGPAATVEPMTKEELDRAKSLVLDLLGWGVAPEYLVECGLSPGAVYKIFTDLKLRLPSNFRPGVLSPPSSHQGAR